MCPKYGAVFQKLRKQHSLPLAAFQDLGISKATLSYFENGKHMITFDKLNAALQEMHTTLADYNLAINDGQPDAFILAFQQIEAAYYREDQATLQEIYERYQTESRMQLVAISAKACYSKLEEAEVRQVRTYLRRVKIWGIYELSILNHTIEQLKTHLSQEILMNFWKTRKIHTSVQEHRLLALQIALKVALLYGDEKDKTAAKYFIDCGREMIFSKDILSRIMLNFVEGYYIYSFESRAMGKKQMLCSLKILNLIEAEEVLRAFQNYYNKRVKH